MWKDTKDYAQSCVSCQERGTSRDRQERSTMILQGPKATLPFERVHIDILGPIGKDSSGIRYLIVGVDHFTKWVEATGTADTPTAIDVNNFVMSHYYFKHGVPDVIIADNGTNITANQLNAQMFQDMGSKVKNVTTYHPQANGQVERFNAVICDFLSHFCTDTDQSNWFHYLEATLFAINTSVSRTTGFTPFFLVHGREAKRVIDKRLPSWENFDWKYPHWKAYAEAVQSKLTSAHDTATSLTDKAESLYNQPAVVFRTGATFGIAGRRLRGRHITKVFKEGDSVLIYIPISVTSSTKLQIKKLNKFWKGPYQVLAKVNDVTYLIDKGGGKTQSFHISRLKPYYVRDARFLQPL